MTIETIIRLLAAKIADESRPALAEIEYHRGRVQAFRFALELLAEVEPERQAEDREATA